LTTDAHYLLTELQTHTEIVFIVIKKKITCQCECIFKKKEQQFAAQMFVDANTLLLIMDLITL